ncbi:hypothetical protein AL060_13820 [Pseudomonas syringae pv. rhaphiolepidis]|nr:hypothetical protein AL060_13820 [Pseudomonas syringae pv. rhaphiolepidis]
MITAWQQGDENWRTLAPDIPKSDAEPFHPEMLVDLRGLSLRNVRLANAMLPYVDLSYSTFEVCILEDICFQGSRLDWVGFYKCNLKRADLLQVMANHSTFERCAMDDAVLIDGDFRLAQFNNVRMPRALMDGADLRDSQLKDVSLAGAKMLDTRFPAGFDLKTAIQPPANGIEPT